MEQLDNNKKKTYWWRGHDTSPGSCLRKKPGEPCTRCGKGVLIYDGLFLLTCQTCGFVAESGVFS